MVGGNFTVNGMINKKETFILADTCLADAIQRARDKIKEKHLREPGNKSSFNVMQRNKVVYQASITDYRNNFTIEIPPRK